MKFRAKVMTISTYSHVFEADDQLQAEKYMDRLFIAQLRCDKLYEMMAGYTIKLEESGPQTPSSPEPRTAP